MKIATRSRFQKHLRRSLIIISTLFIIIAFFFPGHIFLSSYGYLIVTEPDSYSRMIANGNSIAIEQIGAKAQAYFRMNQYGTEGLFAQDAESNLILADSGTVFHLSSRKLGELEIAITRDLLQGNARIEQSTFLNIVDASNYSRKQINLLYQYFDYCLDENGILIIPHYKQKTSVSFFQLIVSLALMVWLCVKCESDNYEVTYLEKYNLRQNIRLAIGILLAFCISITPLLTIL